MNKVDMLYNEYNELRDKLLKNKSLNLREDFKSKLIELDYAMNADYEAQLESNFPMTTTLEKEEDRLEKLISFVDEKSQEQKRLINDYKKLTGSVIELSYLKYTDNLKSYKDRLNNVKKILAIIKEIENILKTPDSKNELRLKVVKNRLMKKELLNLLYEFCLIDNLDTKEIDVNKLIKTNEINVETTNEALSIKENDKEKSKPVELPKKVEVKIENKKTEKKQEKVKKEEEKVKKEEKKLEEKKEIDNKVEEVKEEPKVEKEEPKVEKEVVEQPQEQEEKILTTMPIVDKIGSVVPVNVFESLQKTEEKLPDVVLPSNGLKDDQNDIFVDTKDLFEENEKK